MRPARARGLAPLLITLLGALALLAAACGGDGDDAAGREPAPAALLEAAAARMREVQRFHFKLEHEGGGTAIVRAITMRSAEGDVDGADRLRMSLQGSIANVTIDTAIVVIGDDAWIQNPITRRWERERITVEDIFDPQRGVVALIAAAAARSPRITGRERLDGIDVYRVEAALDSGELRLLPGVPAPGTAVPATAWIGVDDPLVRRIELRGGVAEGEPAGLVRRLTLSRFGESVTIEPPR
jgi:hypothetical protein